MTILGQHTIVEVKQLISLIQAHVDDLQDAWDQCSWRDTDGAAADAWSLDFSNWKSNWDKAIAITLGIDITQGLVISIATLGPILSSFISTDSVTPDESGYNRVIQAIYWPSPIIDSVDPKNLNGLDQRLVAAVGQIQRRVQPAQDAEDFDLDFIRGTSGITQPVDATLAFMRHAGQLTKDNPKKIAAGLIAVVGGVLAVVGLAPIIEAKIIRKIL